MLQINSPGGLIGPASELGMLVNEHDLIVVAYGQCLSACLMPLVASNWPTLAPGADVGLHSGGGSGHYDFDKEAADAMSAYLLEHGVKAEMVSRASRVPFEQMWSPSINELIDGNVIEYVFDLELFDFVVATDWCSYNERQCEAETEPPRN